MLFHLDNMQTVVQVSRSFRLLLLSPSQLFLSVLEPRSSQVVGLQCWGPFTPGLPRWWASKLGALHSC